MIKLLSAGNKLAFTQILLVVGIVAGFAREMALANLFGLGETLDLFRNASLLPVVFSETLNSAFVFALIPSLVAAETMSDEEGRKRVSACLYVSLLLVLAIYVIGSLAATNINTALFPTNASPLLTSATRWSWVMFLLSGLTFGLRGLYFQIGKTWPGAATPAVRSVSFLIALFVMAALLEPRTLDLQEAVIALIISGLAILLIHMAAIDQATWVKVKEAFFCPRFDRAVWSSILTTLLFSLSYYLLNAVPRIIDQGYSSGLAHGSVSAVELSYSFTMAFGILFATAFNMTQAVNISRGFRDRDANRSRDSLFIAYRIAIIAGLCSFAFAIIAAFVFNLLFYYGRMTDNDIQLVTGLFRIQCVGIPFMVLCLIIAQFMIAFGKLHLLLAFSGCKSVLKYILVYFVLDSQGINATVYSFVIVEVVGAIFLIVMAERMIRSISKRETP